MRYATNFGEADRPVHKRYIEFAESYRQAAMDFCARMIRHEQELTWPNANVALMLASHSVELFMKGAILRRNPNAKLRTHNFEFLANLYREIYPESELAFRQPFVSDYPGLSEDEALKLRSDEADRSMIYRYPLEAPGVEWDGLHAFEPESFLDMLDGLGNEFDRIQCQID